MVEENERLAERRAKLLEDLRKLAVTHQRELEKGTHKLAEELEWKKLYAEAQQERGSLIMNFANIVVKLQTEARDLHLALMEVGD